MAGEAKQTALREALRQLASGNTKVPWEAWANGSCSIFAITTGKLVGRTSFPAFVVVPFTWGSQVTIARIISLVRAFGVEVVSTDIGLRADDEQLYICSIGASDFLQQLARGNLLQVPVIDLRADEEAKAE